MIATQTPSQHPSGSASPISPQAAIDKVAARLEFIKCSDDPAYFVANFTHIYDSTAKQWSPFRLWPAQRTTLQAMHEERLLVVLKARQLGLSWLSIAYALWLLIFRPPANVLLFSLKETEAAELLSRLKTMYWKLPAWMRTRQLDRDNNTRFALHNGSRAIAFSTKSGRSYTGTIAIVDEADFIPDLDQFLNAVKPTIDAGGKMFMISTADKRRPISTFKNIFRAAQNNVGDYRNIFLPWQARPERTNHWHDRTRAEMFAQRGTHDDFYAEYPATIEEALAPEQLDRRIPIDWVRPCLQEIGPDAGPQPALPGLTIYRSPTPEGQYVIGADPAEGNPQSDDSAATVLDANTWEEMANLTGKLEPSIFANYLDQLAAHYNAADILPERNNHGHSLILALHDSGLHRILTGHDNKPGWLSNIKGKPILYNALADAIREQETIIHSPDTAAQIASVEASTLRAPKGLHDDRADSYALAIAACTFSNLGAQPSAPITAYDPLALMDESTSW